MADLSALEERIHRDIPLSKYMGVKLLQASSESVRLSAPLDPNQNHKSTAFGGSVYSAAVLACWALVNQLITEEGISVDYVVVQDGEIQYEAPVEGDFITESTWPTAEERWRFLLMLRKKGLARATLRAVVKTGNKECARLRARFAAQVKP